MRVALSFLVCACAATQRPPPDPAEQALAVRLEGVLYRGAAAGTLGDLSIGRAPGGAVRIAPVGRPAAEREDAAVAADVRARLRSDPLLLDREISVDVDRGVARLEGALRGRDQAARAVLTALDVGGVRAVETTLSWVPASDLARLRSHERSR